MLVGLARQELMDKVYAKHGIKSIIGGNTGNQMGGWFKKEINTIEDLKGLKNFQASI
jgi:TRAP-type mannitol/chloroaromatic compound transport system substrate-binding protein